MPSVCKLHATHSCWCWIWSFWISPFYFISVPLINALKEKKGSFFTYTWINWCSSNTFRVKDFRKWMRHLSNASQWHHYWWNNPHKKSRNDIFVSISSHHVDGKLKIILSVEWTGTMPSWKSELSCVKLGIWSSRLCFLVRYSVDNIFCN